MIAHIVLFRFKPELFPEDRSDFLELARSVLGAIPGVQNLCIGPAFRAEAGIDHALVMHFEDRTALTAYQGHADHVRFRDREFRPRMEVIRVLDVDGGE